MALTVLPEDVTGARPIDGLCKCVVSFIKKFLPQGFLFFSKEDTVVCDRS